MKGKLHPFLCDTITKQGFSIIDEYAENQKYYVEMELCSDLGEAFLITIEYDGTDGGFIHAFLDYYDDFDADDHAAALIPMRGTNGVPSSIRAILYDAESIQNKLLDLAVAMANAWVDI